MHDAIEFNLGIVVPRNIGKGLKSIKAQMVRKVDTEKLTGQRFPYEAVQ